MRGDEVVYVAAHPDDEVIGAGAQLSGGAPPLIVHVTDGAPRDMRDAHQHGFATREAYADARRLEGIAALALAGVGRERIVALDVADQEATHAAVTVARRLARLFEAIAPRVVYTHPYEGGHPDHDATALAVHAAVALLARHRAGLVPEVWEFTSYHADPGDRGMRAGVFLAPNHAAEEPGSEVGDMQVELSPTAQAHKRRMLAAFHTQARVLAPFPVDVERFRRAPGYRFSKAPHPGPLHYESFGWALDGPVWRQAAATALSELGLAADEAL